MENHDDADGWKTCSSRNNRRNERVNENKRNRSGSRYRGRKSKDKHGKRGKERAPEDAAQPKEGKEPAKTPVEDTPQRVPESQPQGKQPPPQGKPPKTQPPSTEKSAEATIQAPTPSQTPKSESPTPQVFSKDFLSHPEAPTDSPKESVEPQKKEVQEEHVNNIDESKIANHEENHIGDKPKSSSLLKYPYKEGQWSPDNPEGKLQYDRDFLLEMQKNPLSLKRPDSLPNLEVVLDGPIRPIDGKPKMLSDFTPAFLQTPSRPRIQKVVGRGSQQGRRAQRIIDIKLSTSSEVKLKTSENAWKPSNRKSEVWNDEEDDAKHQDTLKRMRGILNKLTPDNFQRLVVQVKALNIENFYTFDAVIDLIFEKAVDEQAFSTTYAELCKVLSQMSVKVQEKGDETRFRNLIISKCQTEFEKDNSKDLNREKREKEIEAQSRSDKRVELKAMLEFEETRLRKRSVGNIRFIGELYKLKMLTSSIMMRIIVGLLDKKDEESLECLCKLLTTIGKSLEASAQNSKRAQEDLNDIFDSMKKLVETRQTSSRVRFLMMDVIDLRKNNWVPRREDAKPKTKAQVHEEIKKEQQEMEQQILLSSAPRKDDRERKRSRDNRGMMSDDGGWSTVSTNTRRGPFDSSRLRNTTFNRNSGADNHVELRVGFSNWARGSSGGMKEQDEPRPNNRYSVLESQFSGESRRSNPMPPRLPPGGGNIPHRQSTGSFGSKSMPPPSEKENLLSSVKMMVTPGDRSKSNSRSNSRTTSRESSLAREPAPALHETPSMDPDTAEKYTKAIIEEYAHNFDLEEATVCLEEKFKGSNIMRFVQCSLEWVIDRDAEKRKKVGILYHHLLRNKHLSAAQFMDGSKVVMEMMREFEIDIPQVCTYVGEILCRLLVDGVMKLNDILKIIEPASSKMHTIFAKVIKQTSKFMGEGRVAELWKSSGLNWETVLPSGTDIKEYLKKCEIEFTVSGPPASKSPPDVDEDAPFDPKVVRTELTKLFKNKASEEEIFGWIDINVDSYTNTRKFVRALTTALIESLLITSDGGSVVIADNFEVKLKERVKIIHKYVDNTQYLELPCIYGMQSLSVKYQHPPGMLEQSFNVFYDQDVLSEDSFLEWEKDDDPEEQLGKGVCITSVRKFLKWLGEAEETEQPE